MLGLLGMEKWSCTINDLELVFKLSLLGDKGWDVFSCRMEMEDSLLLL